MNKSEEWLDFSMFVAQTAATVAIWWYFWPIGTGGA